MTHYLSILETNKDYTCVIYLNNEIVFTSTEKGVKPMLDFYHQTPTLETDYVVVDRIMGRGAVILAKLIHANTIITPMISASALELAQTYHMTITYNELVPFIINRDKTGHCPIETSVLDITDPQIGYQTIIHTLQNLTNQNI